LLFQNKRFFNLIFKPKNLHTFDTVGPKVMKLAQIESSINKGMQRLGFVAIGQTL